MLCMAAEVQARVCMDIHANNDRIDDRVRGMACGYRLCPEVVCVRTHVHRNISRFDLIHAL